MNKELDLQQLWDAAKHGTVADKDVAACERMLEKAEETDLHLAILIVGVCRKPTLKMIRVMEMYLRDGSIEAERYTAMRVLCRYWGLWSDYLLHLFEKVRESSWDAEYAVAEEAANLLGDFLQLSPSHNEAWSALLSVHEDAVKNGDQEKEDVAYWSIYKALRGDREALKAQLAGRMTRDEEVLHLARRQSECVK